MKFLLLIPSQNRGGAEEYALTIATEARKRLGWDVYAAFSKITETETLIDDFQKNDVNYCPLNIQEFNNYHQETLIRHGKRILRTLSILRSIKPERVLISLPWAPQGFSSIVACAVLKIPTIVVFQLVPHSFSFGQKRLKIYDWARRHGQKWIAVSQHNQRLIAETFRIPEQNILCVYNGTSFELSKKESLINRSANRQEVRAEFGLPSKTKIVLTVGRLHHQKGYDTIIPVIPHIIRNFPKLKFLWVGEGEEERSLRQKLIKYGVANSVIFTGHRQDIPRLLTASDIFLFPTRFEGFPFSLLEAMAHGVPVVSSHASSIPEVIEHRVHGLLFRPEDSCDLLENLRRALQNPEQMNIMAQASKNRVQEFSQASMLDKTLAILQNMGKAKSGI